jgi:putative ABC transport system ATP-binding protein
MKLAARVENLQKIYDLGPAVLEPLGGAKQDLNFAPVGADEGRILVKALRGVTLDFPEGDFVAVMGASGSGKSTLLNLLGGLDRPTSGRYILDGVDVSQMNDAELSHVRNQKLGFIFQSYNLIAQYTVLENIELPLHYRPGYPPIGAAEAKRCLEMATKVGLGERLDHRPFQLSGGQQQRVAIARALVNNPEIILADEPTGNLDSATSNEIMEMLRALNNEGRTIIMVTHETDIAAWAKRQIVMRDGVVYKETRTADIAGNPVEHGAAHAQSVLAS